MGEGFVAMDHARSFEAMEYPHQSFKESRRSAEDQEKMFDEHQAKVDLDQGKGKCVGTNMIFEL